MVVDDSVVVRRLVGDVLSSDADIEVVGTAVNGKAAVTKVDQLRPDLITMDIEMPELDGVSAVRQIRANGSRVPIIMFSTLTDRGATATLDALAAGCRRIGVSLPTGTGKTTVFLSLLSRVQPEGAGKALVIVNSVGPLILEPWIDHPNVTAVRLSSFLLAYCHIAAES